MSFITYEQSEMLDKFVESLIKSNKIGNVMNSEEVNNHFKINTNAIDINKFMNNLPGVNLDRFNNFICYIK